MDNLGAPLSVPVAGDVYLRLSTKTAMVSPVAGNWSKGTLYELYASTDIADLNGNNRLAWSTYTFTTIRDELVPNVAIMRNEPAVSVTIAPNVFNAPYIMMVSSGIATPAVVAANEKALGLGAERAPVKTLEVDSFNNAGQPWPSLLAQNVPMNFTYPDADADGIVDGTKLRAQDPLGVAARREPEPVDEAAGRLGQPPAGQNVVYPTNHFFSVYGLFGSVDADVSDVYAFPVPSAPTAEIRRGTAPGPRESSSSIFPPRARSPSTRCSGGRSDPSTSPPRRWRGT